MSARPPQTLLVFADNEHRDALAAVLAGLGVEAFFAANCAQALELLRSRNFALVFCEDRLTDGDFRMVLAAASSTGVVVCSRLGGLEQYLQVMQSGAYDFIVPPYRPGDLSPILASVLQDYRNEATASGAAPSSGQ
ncbi:MAG: hypothetical protein ACE14L_11620 [Terriglobales bacterium]